MFSRRRLLIIFVLSLLTALLGVVAYYSYHYWQKKLPLLSPLDLVGSITTPVFPTARPQKVVYGFFPYWNLKYSDQLNVHSLTHFAYFGIDLNDDGTIKRYENPGELEPGYHKLDSDEFITLKNQLSLLRIQNILVVRAMQADQIESILTNQAYFNAALRSIMQVAVDHHFQGINIDFEYVGVPSDKLRDSFTHFTRSLSQTCKINIPYCHVSLDVFADSAHKRRIYDLAALAPHIDHLIVMAYDYYRPSSTSAGPVAPLRGACNTAVRSPKSDDTCLEYDVVSSIADITAQVPSDKVLLGIPFYGYQWRTADDAFLSNTFQGSGGLATYRRIQELLVDPEVASLSARWSDSTLSPYLVFQEDGATYQIHYEDENSLKLKLDLVSQADLGGIAIWALGYETPYNQLWSTIQNYLR